MSKSCAISVLAMPLFEPGCARVEMQLPAGSTVAQMVERALPNVRVPRERLRVALVNDRGSMIIEHDRWEQVRPRPGTSLIIRVLPGKGALGAILSIVVAVTAIALGQLWALPLSTATNGALSVGSAQALITAGVTLAGNFLISALVKPPEVGSGEASKPNFAINGWKNELRPDGVVPDVMGRIRMAPPYGAVPYNEVVGDWLYIRAIFCFGYGRLSLSDFRLGDTSTGSYNNDGNEPIEIEVRDGLAGDLPLSLYPRQVVEEGVNVELERPYPRDELGEIIDGGTPEETPVSRMTGLDAAGCSIILQFPAGLYNIDRKSGNKGAWEVQVRIRQRLAGIGAYTTVETLTIRASTGDGFYRQHTWEFPARGRWEVEVTRMTAEELNPEHQSRSVWALVQTLRPEYPINFSKPLALVSMRIKATHQLNGTLDTFNALAQRWALDWDHDAEEWIERETRSPASLFRHVLQSAANTYPVDDSGIDLEQLQDWHDFCRLKGLTYDRVHDFDGDLKTQLDAICAAGRASKRHDGLKWGVVIDRPQLLVVDHISDRNADQFRTSRQYAKPPHAFRVPFLDADNDFQAAERIVPWPGHSGPIVVTEELQLPGVTSADQVWIAARRRMYEIIHRPDSYSVLQEGAVRVATRGDQVMASFATLVSTQMAARVKSVSDNLVELDERVTMSASKSYAIRFRHFADEDDTIGVSVLRPVYTLSGEHAVVRLTGGGYKPNAGDIVHFGEADKDSLPLIVSGVEAGENMSAVLHLIDAAPIIDTLTDAEVPPAWSGRVGSEIDEELLLPTAPRFKSIKTGISGTGAANGLDIDIAPGTGSAAVIAKYRLQHRLVGAGVWTSILVPVAEGGKYLTLYAKGDQVELRALSISTTGDEGPYSTIATVTIGSKDAVVPTALPDGIEVEGSRGFATIKFATGTNAATKQVQIYRTVQGVALNRSTDAIDDPFAVTKNTTIEKTDGDATRPNLISNPGFSSADDWVPGTGWSIASGKASKVPGTAADITQPEAFIVGRWYRIAFTVRDYVAGTGRSRLSGGTDRNGTGRAANGRFYDRIQAVTGNNTFAFAGTSTFNGSIDDGVLFLEGSESIPHGDYDYYLEPQNDDGVPGPVSGPFSVTII